MLTPAYSLTATERVLPRLALDWTTGLAQPGVDVVRAGVATFLGDNGFIQSATANTQRIDWSTGTSGLLIEESRANVYAYSSDYTQATWNLTQNITIGSTTVLSPDGVNYTQKIQETAANGVHRLVPTNTPSVVSGTAYTLSFFAKAAERNYVEVIETSYTGVVAARFDLVNGTVSNLNPLYVNASIVLYPNGCYRCIVTMTAQSTGNPGFMNRIQIYNGASSYQGVAGYGIYLWGCQFETGAFATSYIPTEATTVTRNADVATMTGTNFSDWYNASEGTIGILASVPAYSTSSVVQAVQASIFKDLLNYIRLRGYSNGSGNFLWDSTITTAGASVVDFPEFTTTSPNTLVQQLLSYKLNNCANAVNGTTVNVDTSSAIPLTLDTLYIGSLGGTVTGAQHINKINYWPQRLINNEIQAFSK